MDLSIETGKGVERTAKACRAAVAEEEMATAEEASEEAKVFAEGRRKEKKKSGRFVAATGLEEETASAMEKIDKATAEPEVEALVASAKRAKVVHKIADDLIGEIVDVEAANAPLVVAADAGTEADAPTSKIESAQDAVDPASPLDRVTDLLSTRMEIVVPSRRKLFGKGSSNIRKSTTDLMEAISNLEQVDSREHVEQWIVAQSKFMEVNDEEEGEAESFGIDGESLPMAAS